MYAPLYTTLHRSQKVRQSSIFSRSTEQSQLSESQLHESNHDSEIVDVSNSYNYNSDEMTPSNREPSHTSTISHESASSETPTDSISPYSDATPVITADNLQAYRDSVVPMITEVESEDRHLLRHQSPPIRSAPVYVSHDQNKSEIFTLGDDQPVQILSEMGESVILSEMSLNPGDSLKLSEDPVNIGASLRVSDEHINPVASLTTPPSNDPVPKTGSHVVAPIIHKPTKPPTKPPLKQNLYVKPPVKPSASVNYEQERIAKTVALRTRLANSHASDLAQSRPLVIQDKYINIFSKGLMHDNDGFVVTSDMKKFLTALQSHDTTKLSQLTLGGPLKLVNPSAAWSNDLVGACNNTYRFSSLPSLSSNEIAAEMAELYCMALARDVPFREYNLSPVIEDCCEYLNELQVYPQVQGKVTPYNIFRGVMDADVQGPYISQFLYRDVKMGGFMTKQRYATKMEGTDYMKLWDVALLAQSGNIIEPQVPPRTVSRYLMTGRDLATYVHADEPYQAFYNTCVILMDLKAPMNIPANPVESYFVNLGRADIQAILGTVGRNALLAAWYIKWNTLFIRPETLGIEVERVYRTNENPYKISPELLRNPVIEATRSHNGSALLTQAYPEGAPLHPSTPSGHAAIAGACATVLKFFFSARYEFEVYEPNYNGSELINTGQRTTVGDELNKLASNMSIGRNWAGIHYHMDAIRGLKLGEKVAISCLQELIQRYPQKLSISITKFSGENIMIRN